MENPSIPFFYGATIVNKETKIVNFCWVNGWYDMVSFIVSLWRDFKSMEHDNNFLSRYCVN